MNLSKLSEVGQMRRIKLTSTKRRTTPRILMRQMCPGVVAMRTHREMRPKMLKLIMWRTPSTIAAEQVSGDERQRRGQ